MISKKKTFFELIFFNIIKNIKIIGQLNCFFYNARIFPQQKFEYQNFCDNIQFTKTFFIIKFSVFFKDHSL